MRGRSGYLACLAYLLGVIGWLYVLLFQRKDEFAVYHAKQSMAITLSALIAPVAWVVSAWIIAWIPSVGPIVSVALFSFVIMMYLALLVAWVMGIAYALRGRMRPVPFVGRWGERLPITTAYPDVRVAEEAKVEVA